MPTWTKVIQAGESDFRLLARSGRRLSRVVVIVSSSRFSKLMVNPFVKGLVNEIRHVATGPHFWGELSSFLCFVNFKRSGVLAQTLLPFFVTLALNSVTRPITTDRSCLGK